jgi:hypothetical protein
MTALMPMEKYLVDSYRFSYPDEAIDVHVDRLHEDARDGLKGQFTVYYDPLEGDPLLLHQARITMPLSQSRATFIKQLERRAVAEPLVSIDFQGIIEQVIYRSQKRWEEGEPLQDLAAVDYQQRSTYLLRPLLLSDAPTVIFGRGGLGKSIVGLACGVSVATGAPIFGQRPVLTGPVLYLDWEWDAETHAARMAAIGNWLKMKIPAGKVFYRRMVASLPSSAASIRKLIAQTGAVLVIVDSMGQARGGEVKEDGPTNDVFRAIRTFGCACLILDHITKNGSNQEGPIGSVYSYNGARLMWRLDGIRLEGSERSVLSLTNTKANGKFQPTQGFELVVQADDDDMPKNISITIRDLRDVPELRPKLGRQAQIVSVLREANRALTIEEIHEELLESEITLSQGAIRTELNRPNAGEIFVSIISEGKAKRWGLKSQPTS